MNYPKRFLLPSLLALTLGCLPATAAAGQVDFNGLAEKFFKAHPVDGRSVSDVALDELVATHYALAQIGAIDVRFPREFLDDKGVVEDFKDSLTAILAVHELWLDWIGAPPEQVTKAKADFAELRKFLKGARAGTGASKAKNFFEIFSGAQDVQGALDRLRDGFRSGSMMGVTPLSTKPQVLIVAPNRQHFMELAGALGARQESSRSLYWNDSLANWTEFGWNETQVIALQYPPLKPNLTDFSEGVAMDSKEPTGLHQNVAQRAAVTLCWHTFGNALDPAFETAIGQVAVIDIYGENNTRSGGSGRSNTTDGMTAFIPGGRSEGGLLPPTNADSEWRVTAGKDYFVKPLKEGQKAGAKGGAKAKEEKLVYFQLKSDDTSKRTYVRAPFFGSAAQGKELPAPEFMTDYLEFFRAYKSAFLHWLREFGAAKPVEAHALFAQLLKGIAEAGSAATFEEVVKESYKVPLSTADLGQDSLEARFLAWLGSK
ncbi:MAG: hypothetical protein HUU28_09550 [Planctomycetaceae bacterium]|jgi:hypothetical protein|nr:hypothetical protein [Planctomycetaceae bacterium]